MESYCSLCTFKVPQGANNLILCTIDTIHRLFFVTRLIINQINKWVDFKLENVLVSLHSLKTMGLGPIIFKKWRVTWTFSNTSIVVIPYAYESYSRIWIPGNSKSNRSYSAILATLQITSYVHSRNSS